MFSCDSEKMTIQHMQGVTIENENWEYAHFKCSDCALNCYRKRQIGKYYNSEWKEWIITGWDELRTLDNPKPCKEIICLHNAAVITIIETTSTKEIAKIVCKDCNMNCKAERILGYLWNSIWKLIH